MGVFKTVIRKGTNLISFNTFHKSSPSLFEVITSKDKDMLIYWEKDLTLAKVYSLWRKFPIVWTEVHFPWEKWIKDWGTMIDEGICTRYGQCLE
jgi:hypothetical protein